VPRKFRLDHFPQKHHLHRFVPRKFRLHHFPQKHHLHRFVPRKFRLDHFPQKHHLHRCVPRKFATGLHDSGSPMNVTVRHFALSLKIPRVSTVLSPFLPLRFKVNSFSRRADD